VDTFERSATSWDTFIDHFSLLRRGGVITPNRCGHRLARIMH
jgi:hypothetical protein